MEHDEYVAHLAREARELLAVAGADGDLLARAVPSCPGWTMERLVGHTGRVYRWTAGWLTTGASTEPASAPAGHAVVAWTAAGLDELLAAMENVGATATVATWAGEQPATFWPRRMAIETAVHRWDAENAVGPAQAIDARLAVDAIDEMMDVVVPGRAGDAVVSMNAVGRSMHLHAVDVPGEWLVGFVPAPEFLQVERVHAKGDAAVRGTASDLLLFLWNRLGPEEWPDRLEVFGDADLPARWHTTIRV